MVLMYGATYLQVGEAVSETLSTEVEYVCPLDGERFSEMQGARWHVEADADLDFRPHERGHEGFRGLEGRTRRLLRRLPVCPTSGYVMDGTPLSDEHRHLLSVFVQRPSYQRLVTDGTRYPRLAALYEVMRRPASEIAEAYLSASWEADDLALDTTGAASGKGSRRAGHTQSKQHTYRQKALAYYRKALQGTSLQDSQHRRYQYLVVELNRRLGQFSEATQALYQLGLPSDKPEWIALAAMQQYLIARKDAGRYSQGEMATRLTPVIHDKPTDHSPSAIP